MVRPLAILTWISDIKVASKNVPEPSQEFMILNKEGAMHSAKQIVCKHAIAKIPSGTCYYLSYEVVKLLRAICTTDCFIRE